MDTPQAMQPLEPMLLHSIQQYEGILDCMQKMDTEVGTADPAMLENFSDSLQLLQGEATQYDQILLAQLHRKSSESESIQVLAARREGLLREILSLNKRITEKASRVQSLLAHEMIKLRNGLSAMTGYRQPQHNQGRIVNGSS